MTEWQLIDENTPRGRFIERPTTIKGKVLMRQTFVQERIQVVGEDRVIRISYWCREREAWNFYGKKHPPKYWRPSTSHSTSCVYGMRAREK